MIKIVFIFSFLISSSTYADFTPVCDRTEAMVEWLTTTIGKTSCSDITIDDLGQVGGPGLITTIKGLRFYKLKAGDFDGLSSITILQIVDTGLTVLPKNVFAGLTNLKSLDLAENKELEIIEIGAFNHLDKVTELSIWTAPALKKIPEKLLLGLSSLQSLDITRTQIGSLPKFLLMGQSNLLQFQAEKNSKITTLPDGFFSHSPNIQWIAVRDSSLTTISPEAFHGLTHLNRLFLNDNFLEVLPANLFDGLDSLDWLHLDNNKLTDFPRNAKLPNLSRLDLQNNNLSSFYEDHFANFKKLRRVHLFGNTLSDSTRGMLLRTNPEVDFDFFTDL